MIGEMVGDWMTNRYPAAMIDGKTVYILSDQDKQKIINTAKLLSASAALLYEFDVNTASASAEEAVRWNALSENTLKQFVKEFKKCKLNSDCQANIINQYIAKSNRNDDLMTAECRRSPSSNACINLIRLSLNYIGDNTPVKAFFTSNEKSINDIIFQNLQNDINRSRKITLNLIFENKNIYNGINTIESRADFFDALSIEFPKAQWLSGASRVSRRCGSGLGGSGCRLPIIMIPLSSEITFQIGSGMSWRTDGNRWRAEAGAALMNDGYSDFKDLWEGRVTNYRQWSINRLIKEQTILQPIHEKHILNSFIFVDIPKYIGTGSGKVDVMNLQDRIRYGCLMMGYNYTNGVCR